MGSRWTKVQIDRYSNKVVRANIGAFQKSKDNIIIYKIIKIYKIITCKKPDPKIGPEAHNFIYWTIPWLRAEYRNI